MPWVSCLGGTVPAVYITWMELQWALEVEALQATFVALSVSSRIARPLGKRSTLEPTKLRRKCWHGVFWAREGRDVRTSAVC